MEYCFCPFWKGHTVLFSDTVLREMILKSRGYTMVHMQYECFSSYKVLREMISKVSLECSDSHGMCMLLIKFGMIIEGFTWDALIKFLYNLEEPLFMAGVSSSKD